MRKSHSELAARAKAIRWLLLDVDGVLTDGSISYTDDGHELKRFHVRDGSGLKFWQNTGRQVAILSGRSSPAVVKRATELGIYNVIQGQNDKAKAYKAWLHDVKAQEGEVFAMGDDLPDLAVLEHCGIAATVADACDEVKAVAEYVTAAAGGQGAVREAIEWFLKLTNEWVGILNGYRTPGG